MLYAATPLGTAAGRRGRRSDERRLAIPYTQTYYPLLVYTVAEEGLLVQTFFFFFLPALAFLNHLSSCT